MNSTTTNWLSGAPALLRKHWKDNIVLLALVVLCGVFSITSSAFMTPGNLLNILRQTAVVAVIGLGMTFAIISAEIDVSVGSVMALSAVVAAITLQAGYGWYLGVVAGLAVGFGAGLANGMITVYFGIPSFLVTLGTLATARGLALIITDVKPVIVDNQAVLAVFGGTVSDIPVIVIWAVLMALVAHLVLSQTRFGRHVYSTGDDETAARYAGIDTTKVKIGTLALSGLMAGFGGLLMIGRLHVARPTMGSGIELAVIAAVIIGGTSLFGGKGWIFGTIVGALLMSIINNGLVLNGFSSSYQQFIRGIVIVLAVAFRTTEQEGGWV